MIFEICTLIALIIFAILAFYIYRTLITLQKTLRNLDVLTDELTIKMRKMDSTFQSISNIGDVAQEESSHFRENYMYEKRCCRDRLKSDESSDALTDLLLAGLKVGANYLRRK